jgi:predicted metal-dependent hydrolase
VHKSNNHTLLSNLSYSNKEVVVGEKSAKQAVEEYYIEDLLNKIKKLIEGYEQERDRRRKIRRLRAQKEKARSSG